MKPPVPTYYPRYRIGVRRQKPAPDFEENYGEPPPVEPPPEPDERKTSGNLAGPFLLPPDVADDDPDTIAARMEPLEAPEAPLPRCRCGFDKNHHFVRPRCEFTLMGWFMILMMINPRPKRILYTCARCNEVLEVIDDPEEIDDHPW